MTQYPVVKTKKEIWVFNPKSKRSLKLASLDSTFFDMYVSNSGIFHAVESFNYNQKSVEGITVRFPANYVTILDSISGGSVKTVYPEGQLELPFEDRLVDLEFSFFRDGNSLCYRLNGNEATLFDKLNGHVNPKCEVVVEGNKIYVDGRKAATTQFDISHWGLINERSFSKLAKRKNENLYSKIKSLHS